MICSELVSRIAATFPPQLTERLVEALREGYEVACDNWRPEKGSRSLTFGIDVWAFATFQLEQIADEAELELDVEQREHRTTLVKHGLFLSSYRVGSHSDQSIWTSFPNNRNAAPRLARNNVQIDIFGDAELTGAEPLDLVLAHFGNPDHGLEAVYLCVPTGADGNQISEWGYADLLWRRDGLTVAGTVDESVPPLAPEIPIAEPALRLRRAAIESEE